MEKYMLFRLAYRIDDAADVVGFSRSTLYKDIQSGALKTIRRGRSRRVTHSALLAYVKGLEKAAAASAKAQNGISKQKPSGGRNV